MKRNVITAFVALWAAGRLLSAQSVPALINYQGQLLNTDGTAMATADYQLAFQVYDAPEGGTAIWGPQLFDGSVGQGYGSKIPVVQGYFNVMLGPVDIAGRSITNAFDGPVRYLEIRVGTNAPVTPRQRILSAPFAIRASVADRAENADKLAGKDWSALLDSNDPATGKFSGDRIATGSIGSSAIADGAIQNRHLGIISRLSASDGSPANAVTVDADGRVGIGTNSPSARLEIRDDTIPQLLVGHSSSPWVRVEIGHNGTFDMPFGGANYNFRIGGIDRLFIGSDGKTGIGTTTPLNKLHVVGTTRFDDDMQVNGNVTMAGGISPGKAVFTFQGTSDYSNGRLMYLMAPWDAYYTDRYFMMGFDRNGAHKFYIRGDGAFFNSSSRSAKTNIRELTSALAMIRRMQGVTYAWKGAVDAQRSVGFIAEDLAVAMPEAVDPSHALVNYTAVIPVLVEGVKELHAIVSKQQAQLESKDSEVRALTTRLSNLEERVRMFTEGSYRSGKVAMEH